jgi:Ala-tRNA(Pro) deacylase
MGIIDYLADGHVPFAALLHPPAYTAQRRAKVLHTPGIRVAKSVLLHGPQGYLLAVLPATHRIDMRLLSAHLGGPARLATRHELLGVFLDCEWGAVPAFARRYGLPSVLDDSLPPEEEVLFEGNSHFQDVRLRCADFERIERPRRLRFGQPTHPGKRCQAL